MTLQEPGDLGYNEFHVSLFYLADIDTNNLHDANVKIALKNLAKKNAVTKEKRLCEFLKMLETSAFDVKDYHVLVCWLQLYPRLAIDSQKSVRHLSHQVLATYMEKFGVKEFSKYLKTAMPILLQGLFDDKSIANSVRSDLLRCFGGDEVKVNSKVWVVFHEQIINYCHAVLVHESASSITDERSETSDEVSMKYERAENTAILMLLQTIRLANVQEYFLSTTASTQLNEILTLEQFWDSLGSCSARESINAGLFRSYLALISEVFSLDKEGRLRPFTKNLKDLKYVFKTTSRKLIKNVKLGSSSETSSMVVYSSVIVNLVNTFSALTSFTNQTEIKIKKNFWQYGGLKSYSRLKDVLKLGPCNSDPAYYESLKTLFSTLKNSGVSPEADFPFLDFTSGKDAKNIIQKTLLPHFRMLKGFNSLVFKYQGIQCLTYVLEIFASNSKNDKELDTLAQILFVTFLDEISISRLREDDVVVQKKCHIYLAKHFVIFLEKSMNEIINDLVSGLGEKNFQLAKVKLSGDYVQICFNFYLVLCEISPKQGEDFLQAVVETLEDTYDVSSIEQGLSIVLNAASCSQPNSFIINWAATSLPSFITSELVILPLKFFKTLLEANTTINYQQMINDFYAKISIECPEYLISFFGILSNFKESKDILLCDATPDAYAFLISISQNEERLDLENAIILDFIDNPTICKDLLKSTVGNERQIELIKNIVARGSCLKNICLHSFSTNTLVSCALDFVHVEYAKEFLKLFADQNVVRKMIFEKLQAIKPNQDLQALVDFLAQNKETIPFEEVNSAIDDALDRVDLLSLSISNPLSQNVNLIRQPDHTSLSPLMLTLAAFLGALSRAVPSDDTIRILASICVEYVSDYNFLTSSSEDEAVTKLISTFDGVGVNSIHIDKTKIAEAFNGSSNTPLIDSLFEGISGKGLFTARQYYTSRILVNSLNPVFENMSLSSFQNIEIPYLKLGNNPLQLATLICSASKFVGISPKLDKIRNFVFAEILSVRSTADICESGLIWVSLANSFIDVPIKYEIVPVHKVGMVVNHLAKWLECDIAFDKLFSLMRALLASFFYHFTQIMGDNIPDKTWGLSIDLCLNNFGMAQLTEDLIALEYFSLKLFLVLLKNSKNIVSENWKQSQISIEEEILSLIIAKQIEKKHFRPCHQPSVLLYRLFERILLKATFTKEILSVNIDNLYEMLHKSEVKGAQKIACLLIKTFIYENQQDLILEVQMRISNISGESEPTDDLTRLNYNLLQTISDQNFHLEESFDQKKYHDIFSYLYSWVIVFEHFKESTYSMKASYINQLKENDSINILLNTIIDALPLTEQNFLNKLVLEPIEKNAKVKPSESLVQAYAFDQSREGCLVKDDVQFLLAHLCYQTFQFLGSFALQWFSDIRDVQLKQQVEKFSIRFVSPILISEMLEEVEKAKDKLVNNDDTLTIKVNKVTNEVRSIYVIDEQTMEMVIKIPENFPLSNVLVEGPTRLGVKENQWKAWLLASQRVITLTNGSIFDSIELFNKNVNLHFSGFEECAICYSILHQDHSLPSKNCSTCLNKFHAACLYKWFKSSGSSTCPLCRSAFNFNAGRNG